MIVERDPLQHVRKKVQDGKLYVHTESLLSDRVNDQNQKLRSARAIERGAPAPFNPDGAEVIYMMQAPAVEWRWWVRKNPDAYRDIHSKNQVIREAAVAKLRAEKPHWFVEVPRVMVAVK